MPRPAARPGSRRGLSFSDLLVSALRRLLLGHAPTVAAAGGTDRQFRDDAFHLELLAVRGPAGRYDDVFRQCDMPPLEELLQHRLGILAGGSGIDFAQRVAVQAQNRSLGGAETPVQEDR